MVRFQVFFFDKIEIYDELRILIAKKNKALVAFLFRKDKAASLITEIRIFITLMKWNAFV
jgi:hypothetical protein